MKVTITISAQCWIQAFTLIKRMLVWVLKCNYSDAKISNGITTWTDERPYGKVDFTIQSND